MLLRLLRLRQRGFCGFGSRFGFGVGFAEDIGDLLAAALGH